jgi:hypothetical protein
MKIAHVILTHQNPKQLLRLVNSLVHPETYFFIHLDLKADLNAFKSCFNNENVIFIKDRVQVKWGTYSMVRATLNSFKEVLSFPLDFDYINLLSGQDYPLKSTQSFHDFLKQNEGFSFMHYWLINTDWLDVHSRIFEYHFDDFNFVGKFKLAAVLNAVLPKRKLPYGLEPVGRSQWFTVHRVHLIYMMDYLEKHPKYIKYFRLTWGCDEFFFQTILYNSVYKEQIINNNLRYIDWSEGNDSPKTLTISDLENLKHAKDFFARKFDETKSAELLKEIDVFRDAH